MKTAVYSARRYDKTMLTLANQDAGHELRFLEDRLSLETATLARGYEAVCVFVNDTVDAEVLEVLARQGTRLVATRSTGYNHVDAVAAQAGHRRGAGDRLFSQFGRRVRRWPVAGGQPQDRARQRTHARG